MSDPTQPDAFHRHEVVDRCYMAHMIVVSMLAEHPAVAALPSAQDKLTRAQDLLLEAYQEYALAWL